MPTGEGVSARNTLGALLSRVRRFWFLVLVIVGVAGAGAVAATAVTPTTYVGRTSLIVSSNNRSPDQDAVLVQGYVTYFNDEAYERRLLNAAGIRGEVALSAEAAASSPILVISATTADPNTAQSYAIQVASTFRDDINRVDAQSKAAQLAALQEQLDAALASRTPNASVISNLQDRIDSLRSDQVNVLQELQAEGGVAAESPSLRGNLLLALAGGLSLGVLAALALARLSQRLPSALEVADKVGVETLLEIPGPQGRTGRRLHDQRMAQLATITRAQLAGPGVLAVAQAEAGWAAPFVAFSIAREWAAQGYPTVLVQLDTTPGAVRADSTTDTDADRGLRSAPGPQVTGGTDAAPPRLRPGPVAGLALLQVASRSADDTAGLSVSRVGQILQDGALAGRYVVVEAPALVRSGVAQAVCQTADHTVLVVDTRTSRAGGAREAVAVLRRTGARLTGAVLTTVSKSQLDEGGIVQLGAALGIVEHRAPESSPHRADRTDAAGAPAGTPPSVPLNGRHRPSGGPAHTGPDGRDDEAVVDGASTGRSSEGPVPTPATRLILPRGISPIRRTDDE